MESFQNTPPKLSLFKHQVSGKAPKMITPDNKTILKCYVRQQQQFYRYFSNLPLISPACCLLKFLSRFHGVFNLDSKPSIQYSSEGQNREIGIWLDHVKMRYDKQNQQNQFILISNFLYGYSRPNVLDIKVGGKPKKPQKSPTSKPPTPYKIKLNGMLKTDKNNIPQFISKYLLNQIRNYPQLLTHIAFFFTESNQLRLPELKQILDQLQELVLAIRANYMWRFQSTSICLIYDSGMSGRAQVRFIDFGRAGLCEVGDGYDQVTCAGLEYVVRMVKDICENPQHFDGVQLQKKQGQIVPKQKILKFESQQKPLPPI